MCDACVTQACVVDVCLHVDVCRRLHVEYVHVTLCMLQAITFFFTMVPWHGYGALQVTPQSPGGTFPP